MAAADPNNPQSWNRYAYVLNNPLNATDPTGLDCVYTQDDGNFFIKPQDCFDQNDNGFYFDGTVDRSSVRPTQDGDVIANVDSGSGFNTTCSGDCPDSVISATVNGYQDDVPIYGGGGQIIRQIANETYQFNKQANCLAAAAYPWLPGLKPDDAFSMTESSLQAGGKGADAAAKGAEDTAEAVGHGLKRNGSGVIRNRSARVSTAMLKNRAKQLERVGKLMENAGHVMAAYESIDNFITCEGKR